MVRARFTITYSCMHVILVLISRGASRCIMAFIKFSNGLTYGARIMSSSTVNNCRYGDIFPFVRSELDREIQGLSFIVWCAVEIL